MIGRIVPILVVISVLTGCGSMVTSPNDKTKRLVTIDDTSVEVALKKIGQGIGDMKEEFRSHNMDSGLYVDSIDLDLDLNAHQNEEGKLTLSISPLDFTSLSKVSGKLDAGTVQSLADIRSSKLKIRFRSNNSYNLERHRIIAGQANPSPSPKPNPNQSPSSKPEVTPKQDGSPVLPSNQTLEVKPPNM